MAVPQWEQEKLGLGTGELWLKKPLCVAASFPEYPHQAAPSSSVPTQAAPSSQSTQLQAEQQLQGWILLTITLGSLSTPRLSLAPCTTAAMSLIRGGTPQAQSSPCSARGKDELPGTSPSSWTMAPATRCHLPNANMKYPWQQASHRGHSSIWTLGSQSPVAKLTSSPRNANSVAQADLQQERITLWIWHLGVLHHCLRFDL